MRRSPFLVSCSLAALLVSCGSADPDDGVDAGAGGGRYLPLAVGSTWTYRITKDSIVTEKVSTVEALETLTGDKAGISAYRVRTEKAGGETVSWQQDTGTAIVRHREESYDSTAFNDLSEVYAPSKIRLDETAARLAAGATFTDSYAETVTDHLLGDAVTTNSKADTWTVVAVDVEVTVPAGTFSCVYLHKQGLEAGQSDKYYWYARGVGKVKEAGGQLEELSSYTLAD